LLNLSFHLLFHKGFESGLRSVKDQYGLFRQYSNESYIL